MASVTIPTMTVTHVAMNRRERATLMVTSSVMKPATLEWRWRDRSAPARGSRSAVTASASLACSLRAEVHSEANGEAGTDRTNGHRNDCLPWHGLSPKVELYTELHQASVEICVGCLKMLPAVAEPNVP